LFCTVTVSVTLDAPNPVGGNTTLPGTSITLGAPAAPVPVNATVIVSGELFGGSK
jgi:hypothetical protein